MMDLRFMINLRNLYTTLTAFRFSKQIPERGSNKHSGSGPHQMRVEPKVTTYINQNGAGESQKKYLPISVNLKRPSQC